MPEASRDIIPVREKFLLSISSKNCMAPLRAGFLISAGTVTEHLNGEACYKLLNGNKKPTASLELGW